jgi:Leucine-rich repeat (LRR) protein
MKRCKRIQHIRCHYIKSLEGCPNGLKSLYVDYGFWLKSLEPLSACKKLEIIKISFIKISDLSPLSSCKRLKKLRIEASRVTDLTPLSSADARRP